VSTAATIDHYRREYGEVEPRLAGGQLSWLTQARNQALDRFAEKGFPGPRDEDWKYTRVSAIEKRAYKPAAPSCVGMVPEDLEAYYPEGLACHRMVFINGRYQRQLSVLGELPDGAHIDGLARSLDGAAEELEPYLARLADPRASAFPALNTAFMEDGAFISLPRGVELRDPIHLLFVSTGQEDDACIHPRILVVAGEQSSASIIESYVSLGDSSYLNNAITEVTVQRGARVNHYKLQQESIKAYHVATLQVTQERDSRFDSHSVSLGARIARNDINVHLAAEGAECNLNGLYIGNGRQHVDFHTRVDHAMPHGTSREDYKGILSDHSRGVFNGQVHVHPDAQKTDAEQSNKNLLLSPTAEVDTKPQLEIYADDVKCAHGATVGQLDEHMVFYLRSRGIDEATARGLLTYGFARDIVDRIELPELHAHVEQAVAVHLPGARNVIEMIQ